jgi:hypothetical protein
VDVDGNLAAATWKLTAKTAMRATNAMLFILGNPFERVRQIEISGTGREYTAISAFRNLPLGRTVAMPR